ncbi:hypothetical protein HN587_00915 [Candidatus Woesearchaeota archaeon]|jgi:hypothetical protein|nr:hypothetical protein [Candidatus Woesearchaeota archaeon]
MELEKRNEEYFKEKYRCRPKPNRFQVVLRQLDDLSFIYTDVDLSLARSFSVALTHLPDKDNFEDISDVVLDNWEKVIGTAYSVYLSLKYL